MASSLALAALLHPARGWAFDTGVADDRVSLPDGPGTLEGVGENVSVSAGMGLMRYSVPVEVPAGFEGLTPDLSLGYSSGGASTMVGMGWSMATPSIERMTMRGVPRYDEGDRFVSDGGNELVRVSEAIGASEPAVYRNRFESDFTRYTWHQRDGGAGGYWQAEYADGRVGYFGADAQGRVVPSAIEAGAQGTFQYHLVEMTDVYGHRVRYSHTKDGAISLLSKVEYVFTGGAPVYTVDLSYEGRSDAVSDAKSGFDRILTRRLAGIVIRTRGQQLRRYALGYEDDAVSGRRSRLRSVESFGSTDARYPVVHSFGYSRGLGAQCAAADCGKPLLITMTDAAGLGVTFQSGTANLVDINGDALPDLIDASNADPRHRFFVNQLSSDGRHTFAAPTTSGPGEVSAFPLSSPRVQFIDVNGDGFTDLLSGGTSDQKVLLNRGTGDWTELLDLPGSAVWSGADAELRFMDYDNDMDIDLIRSTATETFVFENDGSFDFTRRDLAPLGVAFSESIQFTDMNGDGLLEVVQLQAGQIQFKTNFGRGRFADEWSTLSHPFQAGEFELALVEDLDSDGYADIAVVTGNTVKYVLNRNGEGFEPVRTLSAVDGQSLPNREATTTVLAADMNGNGSIDIVWVSATGSVQYLDLFPVRSHLLTRIENGLGRVTEIAYQPSVEQAARSREEGAPWVNPLPYPMAVVSHTDEYDLLTNVHDVVDYRYRDGFYDGIERQFRGYAEVSELLSGDSTQAAGRVLMRYDVGREQPHLNGQVLFERRESDGKIVDETSHVFGDAAACPVAEVPSNAQLLALGRKPIGFACEVATETVLQEGTSADQWITTRTRVSYDDGYGNVGKMSEEGVVALGGGACAPCQRSEDLFGAPCGAQCLGDEAFTVRTYVPVSATDGRWILGKVARERRFGAAEGAAGQLAEDVFHYDGEAFVGLPEGQLTQGKLTHVSSRVDGSASIDSTRHRFDVHGNVVETLDPVATLDAESHRRVYTYDEDGLRVVQTDLLNEGPDGSAYALRRTFQYDTLFDKVVLTSSWMMVAGGSPLTAADPTAYTYDAFGRVSSFLLPGGDTGASPTVEFEYDLGNPNTRLITRRRSQVGGALDLETIACVDGRGRTYQTRRKVADGAYVVDGFTRFNLKSQPVEVFQSYTSASAACDDAPPSGVLATKYSYDGVDRLIELTHADDEATGGISTERVAYAPLRTLRFDGEDTDSSSLHFDTPDIETVDGLGRLVATERRLADDTAVTRIEYDALGHIAGYVDAQGNRKAQTHDALGRLLRVEDPNSGTMTFGYDAVGNMVERVDGRGVAMAMRYDGLNREVERFDPANRDATLITTEWDASPNCELSRCPNTAGNMVFRSYPGGADLMGYDVRRRPFTAVRVIEGRTYDIETRYDNADRVVERVYPDGRSLRYAYDGASRLTAIPGVVDEVTYNAVGLMDSWIRANGVVDQLSYDQRLRVKGIDVAGAGGMVQALAVGRDRANNVLRVEDRAADALAPTTTFEYDALYRSTAVRRGSALESMAFDLLDNALTKGSVEYAYGARPGAPSAVGGERMEYDAAGSVTRAYGFEHTWDFAGRLVASVGDAGTVESVYGAEHFRVARHSDGEVTHYVADDFEVRDGISVIYPRIGRVRVARLESSDYASTWIDGVDGASEAQPTAGVAFLKRAAGDAGHEQWLTAAARRMLANGRPTVVSLHQDYLGSLTAATGAAGEVLGRRTFGAFGEELGHTGFVDRYGFTGQEHEPHTGLVHFAHRSLSTRTGQWMSPDPAFQAVTAAEMELLPEAVARYSYVLNNPGTFVDPDGLSRWGNFVSKVKAFFANRFGRNRAEPRQRQAANPRYGRRFAPAPRRSAFSSLMSSIRGSLAQSEGDVGDNDSELSFEMPRTEAESGGGQSRRLSRVSVHPGDAGWRWPSVSRLSAYSAVRSQDPINTGAQTPGNQSARTASTRSSSPVPAQWRFGVNYSNLNGRHGHRF